MSLNHHIAWITKKANSVIGVLKRTSENLKRKQEALLVFQKENLKTSNRSIETYAYITLFVSIWETAAEFGVLLPMDKGRSKPCKKDQHNM